MNWSEPCWQTNVRSEKPGTRSNVSLKKIYLRKFLGNTITPQNFNFNRISFFLEMSTFFRIKLSNICICQSYVEFSHPTPLIWHLIGPLVMFVNINSWPCFPNLHRWTRHKIVNHYNDIIMSALAYQITSITIVYSTVYSGTDQRKHQSSVSLAFVRGIHRWPVNSPHKWPVTRKMFPFDDVIMYETSSKMLNWKTEMYITIF